ncbi:hypothetical protein ABW20_dc0101021 [Dactylellina cionopaga]|nr:hypothetical protein ABW20_dc0101021 [Dactylellina cionopaga]
MPTSFLSYGAMPSSPPPGLNNDSDQTLANTPLLQAALETHMRGSRDDSATESSPLITHSNNGHSVIPQVSTDRRKQRQNSPRILVITLGALCSLTLMILVLGFFLPEVAQEYARSATHFQLDSLSVDSFTVNGVQIRIQAQITLDSTKVESPLVKSFGISAGFLARQIKIGSSKVRLYLPEYQSGALGTATYPDFVINLEAGHTTNVDILCEVVPGSLEGIKPAISDYLAGKINSLRVQGESDIQLNTGILPLGTHKIIEEVIVKSKTSVTLPPPNIINAII